MASLSELIYIINKLKKRINCLSSQVDTISESYLPENQTIASYHVWEAEVVEESPENSYSQAHGTVTIGNKIYIGTRTFPGTITVFNDPVNDLTDYVTESLTGENFIENLVYDSVNHKLYAVPGEAANLRVIEINPDDITDWSLVFEDVGIYAGGSPTIQTDGEYIYGATYADPSIIFKIRISDWTLVDSVTWTGASYAHGSAIQIYSDRTEIYLTSTASPFKIAKVNAADLTFTSVDTTVPIYTDDVYFKKIDNTGGYLYAASEQTITEKGIRLDTRDMSFEEFWSPASYGIFSDGTNLYSAAPFDALIVKYPNFDISKPEIYRITGSSEVTMQPNEMFFVGSNIFMANWFGTKLAKLNLNKDKTYENQSTYSLNIGYNNIIKAPLSLAVGANNTLGGIGNVAIGNNNNITTNYAIVIGDNITSNIGHSVWIWSRLFIDKDTGVGIGTVTPDAPFDVAVNSVLASTPTTKVGVGSVNSTNAKLTVTGNLTAPAAPASASGVISAGTGGDGDPHLADGNAAAIRVYSFKNTFYGRVYSTTYAQSPVVNDAEDTSQIKYTWTWPAVAGADGYLILLNNTNAGSAYTKYHVSSQTTFIDEYKDEGWQSPVPALTTPAVVGVYTDGTFQGAAIPTYANEAAAVTAGLSSGTIYKTATGELRVKL